MKTLVEIQRANRRYRAWRQENPARTFSDFYVEKNLRKIAEGRVQPNLGREIDVCHERMAHQSLTRMEKEGLLPGHRVVDYGCGSLRMGRVLVPFLDQGNYWGVDVTSRFFQMGLDASGQEVIERKPRLDVISQQLLNQVAHWQPDLVFCQGVFFHIPPKEAEETVSRLVFLARHSAVTQVKLALWRGPTVQTSPESWLYSRRRVKLMFRKAGARLALRDETSRRVKGLGLPYESCWGTVRV